MGYNLISVLKDISTKIGNIIVPNTGTNIDGVASAINNKNIPDPNTELANITSALNNLSGMFGGKFYAITINNYSTNGTWGSYTSFTRQFSDLPSGATGPGKTFMLIHNVDVRKSANTNFESRIQLYGVPGFVYIDTHRFVGSNNLWPRFNHISFIKCDTNPIFDIGVCSAGAQANIYSTLILVPLN